MGNIKVERTISFKVSEQLKQQYSRLTKLQKKNLHHKLRLDIAEAIHMSKFNPRDYFDGVSDTETHN
jgi:hypothetical protein